MSVSTTQLDPLDEAQGHCDDLVWLGDAAAADTALTGSKAANLAVARRAGLPVLDGFVLTTVGTSRLQHRARHKNCAASPLGDAWRRLSGDGARPLAVRSSSVGEDTTTSSMAGRFVSVLHVVGWEAFVDAVFEVVASAASTELGDAPMAVLVQPMAEARLGGVLFGIDPLTGDRRRSLASVVEGLPEQIVSGRATGTQVVLGRRGRIHRVSGPLPASLGARHRHALARLARRTAAVFGGPQDVEWLIDPQGVLRLLQSRPITASALPATGSHPLGPGPVAETFPDPLSPLERDLWEPPLEDGIREALRISGAVRPRALSERFVIDVGGRVAVDLEALGVVEVKRSFLRVLDPRPPYRRLRAAWRIGRLRGAMPHIAHDLVEEVDGHLAAVPDLARLADHQLDLLLANAQQTLGALHAHEVLAGFFLDQRRGGPAASGAAVALAAVARARLDGLDDDEIVARFPVALALLPPRIETGRPLPEVPATASAPCGDSEDPMALAREALRLRVRWVQELTARAAIEAGARLAGRGQLRAAADVRDVPLDHLRELLRALDVAGLPRPPAAEPPPLPAQFRLAIDGTVVPDVAAGGAGAIGASAGRVTGTVSHDPAAAAGTVLVVRTLDPGLAGALPGLAAVVAETGSPLSHLAILAREYRVPAVVGVADALAALPAGARVLVDGSAGTVEVLAPPEPPLAAGPAVATGPGAPVVHVTPTSEEVRP